MSTVRSDFFLLHRTLCRLGFNGWDSISQDDVYKGCPHTYAIFIRFIFLKFPEATSFLLNQYSWFIIESDDIKLGGSVIRLLSRTTGIPAKINVSQFARSMYACQKIELCRQLVDLLKELSCYSTSLDTITKPKTSISTIAPQPNSTKFVTEKNYPAPTPPLKDIIDERRRTLNSLERL